MGKKLDFTDNEQNIVTNALMSINEILLLKMDEGVTAPELYGTMDVDNENKKVTFSFKAQRKVNINQE